MDLISIENHENTRLESRDFQFNLFHIQGSNTPPHWHNHREIIYIRKGCCSVYISGSMSLCRQGDLVFVPSGSLHSILSEKSSEYYALVISDSLLINFNNDIHCNRILTPFFSEIIQKPVFIKKSDTTIYMGIISTIETIIKEANDRKPGFELIIKMEICRFFTEIIRNYPHIIKDTSVKENISALKMKSVIEYIFVHFKEKITISSMADFSNMSNQHFCRVFKSYTGKTFVNFLTNYRLEQSNLLLKTTDLPITRIPELIGFCNGNYFTRIYKKKFGYPPSFTRKKKQT